MTQTLASSEEIFSDELLALPHISPSGLALVANLPKTEREVTIGDSRWQHARHVDYVDNLLVELTAGELAKQGYVGIIVEEPPRHGKSELCSHYFPAWYLGARPDNRVILCSYESTFADSWGRKARDTLELWGEPFYGIKINPRSSAANRWDILGHRGGMITAGVGGGITGRGGDLLIVDDPVKDMATAQSETFRNKHWEWYTSTFRSRLEPGGIIVIIGTRWHEDDLIGRIINAMETDPEADQFLRIRMPAICEEPDEDFPEPDLLGRKPGEVLWPERWGRERFVPLMANTYNWNSLYQQRPAPKEGALFKEEWLDVVPMPGGKWRKIVRRWDMAATDPKDGDDPDYTVGLKLGLHEDGLYYVLDVVRFRKDPGGTEREIKNTTARDGRKLKFRVEREPGSQGKLYVRHLARTIFRGLPFRGVPSTGSKYLRADTVAGAAERGEIKIVRGAWNREFIKEVTRFPNAAHDDQVDALSGAFQDLTKQSSLSEVSTW